MVDLYSRGDYILSGKPYLIRENISTFKTKYELSPNQTRSLFHQYGWHKIVGFHTRNIPHRGHQYIQKMALDFLKHILIIHLLRISHSLLLKMITH